MAKAYRIGRQALGVKPVAKASVEQQFHIIPKSGVFDYLDRLPPRS